MQEPQFVRDMVQERPRTENYAWLPKRRVWCSGLVSTKGRSVCWNCWRHSSAASPRSVWLSRAQILVTAWLLVTSDIYIINGSILGHFLPRDAPVPFDVECPDLKKYNVLRPTSLHFDFEFMLIRTLSSSQTLCWLPDSACGSGRPVGWGQSGANEADRGRDVLLC